MPIRPLLKWYMSVLPVSPWRRATPTMTAAMQDEPEKVGDDSAGSGAPRVESEASLRGKFAGFSSANVAIVLLGFLLNLIGVIGGPIYLAPAQRAHEALSLEIALQTARAKMIRAATAFDELAEHLGSLVFSVSVDPEAPQAVGETIHELRLRALDHRHDAVRSYIAKLAVVAGAVDFRTASQQYEALVEAERANFNIDTYRAANAFEADLATRMVKEEGDAAMRAITLQGDRTKARQTVVYRGMTLFLVTTLGSTLVFLAAMAAASRPAPAPEPGSAQRPPGAIGLLTDALTQLRARSSVAQGASA
jgi:hypothetical protein